jgi:acyl dehydratase
MTSALLLARAVLTRRHDTGQLSADRLTVMDETVDPDRLWRYQRLCAFRVDDVLPPTYLHVVAFPLTVARMARPDFPFPLLGLVHLSNTLRQHRPVTAAELVSLTVQAGNRREHPAGELVDLVTEARVGAEPVWKETSSYLHRRPADRPTGRRPGSDPASAGRPDDPQPPVICWDVPADIGRRYAAVSDDRNPIHLYPLTARLFGFRRPIAHGMWLVARTLAAFEGRLPASFELTAAFKTPVLLPARVELRSGRPGGDWNFRVCDAETGKPHLAGTITR